MEKKGRVSMLGCPLMEIKSILEILEIFFIKKHEKKKGIM